MSPLFRTGEGLLWDAGVSERRNGAGRRSSASPLLPPQILGQLDFYLQGACAVFFLDGWGSDSEGENPPYLLFWLLVIPPQVIVKAPLVDIIGGRGQPFQGRSQEAPRPPDWFIRVPLNVIGQGLLGVTAWEGFQLCYAGEFWEFHKS